MKIRLITGVIALAFASSALLSAASFTHITTCTTPASTVTGTTSCTNFNNGYATAQADASLSLAGNRFTFQQFADSIAGFLSRATARDEAAFTIGTAGLVRQGFVQGAFYESHVSEGVMGNYVVTFDGQRFDSTSTGENVSINIHPIAVQLGIPLTFQSLVNTSAAGLGPDQGAFGWTEGFILSLSFFEADGTTPVAISEVPEPGARTMLVAGGLLVAMLRLSASRSRGTAGTSARATRSGG